MITDGRHHGFFAALRATVSVGVFLFVLSGVINAAEPEMRLSSKKVRDEVHAVVNAQLSALREADFEGAYALASEGVRFQFDVRLFAALIRRGYPALIHASGADVGIVRDRDGELAQVVVSVMDREKRSIAYKYWLVKEKAGWRINGVVLEQRPPRGDI